MLKFPEQRRTRPGIHLTALIDMVFLLLIYFLLTSNFIEQEAVTIQVPKVERSSLFDNSILMVVVDQGGRFLFENQLVTERQLGQFLQARLIETPNRGVVIRADKRVVYDRVMLALDIAKRSGANQLSLAVEQRTGATGRELE